MKPVLLDTSFIISAIRNKIDFFTELEEQGFQILIPEQVVKELRGLKNETALKLLENSKTKFKKIPLKGATTDKAIINYAKQNPKTIIATLDREIKKSILNRKLVIRGKKKLEVV